MFKEIGQFMVKSVGAGVEATRSLAGNGFNVRGDNIKNRSLYMGEGNSPTLLPGLRPRFDKSLTLPKKPGRSTLRRHKIF